MTTKARRAKVTSLLFGAKELYELSIEASSKDEKIMVNWFPMSLKDDARSWLLNVPVGSVSSWDEMRERFIANFQGMRDRRPAAGDLRRIMQQPGETLQNLVLTSSSFPRKQLITSPCTHLLPDFSIPNLSLSLSLSSPNRLSAELHDRTAASAPPIPVSSGALPQSFSLSRLSLGALHRPRAATTSSAPLSQPYWSPRVAGAAAAPPLVSSLVSAVLLCLGYLTSDIDGLVLKLTLLQPTCVWSFCLLAETELPIFFLEKPKQTWALSGVEAMAHVWGSTHLNLRLWYMSPSLFRVALQDQIETRSHGSSV
ncbi:uncharacterized protein [Triticum aestivum]|uniref:uncharacterized protein n=1 Tax=Triticum aestivum TaxID=4565 RepID=UPI001D02EAF1|nr:uncharacterized protein LOC123157885 [Triticum aestivum]